MNPNIAMGVNNLQLNNPLDAYAKMVQVQGAQNQNALAQYRIDKAQRDDSVQNALSEGWGAYDPSTGDTGPMLNKLRERGAASAIPDVLKKIQEGKDAKTKSQSDETKLIDSRLELSQKLMGNIKTPEEFWQQQVSDLKDPVLGPIFRQRIESMTKPDGQPMSVGEYMEGKRRKIMQAAQDPNAFAAMLSEAKLGYKQFAELNKPVIYQRSSGDETWMDQVTPGGPAVEVPGSRSKMKMTPGQAAQVQLAQQREGRMAASGGGKEDMTPEEELDFLRRKEAARALGKNDAKVAGTLSVTNKASSDAMAVLEEIDKIDPKTGKSLLNTSTASGVGTLFDKVGNFIGASSEGAESAAALRVIEGKLLAVAPKLGGSTSNADLKFYKQSVAEIGDSRIPAAQKARALETIRAIKMKEMSGSGDKPKPTNRKPLTDILGE
jgi:hypothetical protein